MMTKLYTMIVMKCVGPERTDKIHQIWFQGESLLPDKYVERVRQMKNYYLGGYTLWDNVQIRNLIQQKYSHLLTTYDEYTEMITKIDLAKYVILHSEGGLYIDMDMEEKYDGSLGDVINLYGTKLIFYTHDLPTSLEAVARRSPMINNNFMYSPYPKHLFYELVLEEVPKRSYRRFTNFAYLIF
jgi:mannosyltransferase OCH1-like enzyme